MKLALWLLAIAWITIGVAAAALHFVIVPRIGELRPWLEQQASKELGVTVRIGAIQAQSNGLIPAIEIRDVRLLDKEGREALSIPTVMAALSARSALGLGFEQLHVDGLVLDVRRSADGRIWVAGFALPQQQDSDSARADWLFEQAELAVRHATLHWTDETRKQPTLTLSDVDLVLRNHHRRHDMRLDATPPAHWGQRFTLQGRFRQPLLSGRHEPWRVWDGQMYADFQAVDLEHLKRYADLGVQLDQGSGAVRAWVDVQRGAPVAATADVALRQVSVRTAPTLERLALNGLTGRFSAKEVDGGVEYATQALQFDTQDGLRWPGGNLRVRLLPGDARVPERGELQGDQLDLAAMAQVAERLPLGEGLRHALQEHAPRGLVRKIQAQWQGPLAQPLRFTARGRLEQLAIAAQPAPAPANGAASAIGVPGFRGATVDFDMSQAGGQATLAIQDGAVDLPGVFEVPVLQLDQFNSEVQWKVDGAQLSVTLPNARFANADAQGEVRVQWRTAPLAANIAPGSAQDRRYPGLLDMQGSLARAQLARVYRYMPLALDAPVRDYLRDAVLRGTASAVKFKLKGNLHDFPYSEPLQGDFQVSAKIADADFAYVPASLLHKDSLPWPAVHLSAGDFLIDRGLLQVRSARANVAGLPGLQIAKAEGTVRNLYHGATLSVSAEARGPLPDMLRFVNGSPLGAEILGGALSQASGTGVADYRFKLGFPLAAIDHATVQGTVTLNNNELQITPQTPRMARARAVIGFSETGFTVTNGQVRGLGGDARIDGGMYFGSAPAPAGMPQQLRINGVATAEGLRQAHELGLPSRLAQFVSGSTPYGATIGMRAGAVDVGITSNLVGLSSQLPAPFAKAADASLPLRVEIGAPRGASAASGSAHLDQVQLEVGRLASIAYVRDVSGADARVLRGAIGVGLGADESAPLPAEGVIANANLQNLDLDAWNDVVNGIAASGGASAVAQATGYLPNTMAVRARSVAYGGRKLNNVVLGGTREGMLWRANVDASELSGYVEYRQPSGAGGGRLYARMARLAIAQSTAQDVESLLEEQPASIPALDVVVEDFELRGKKLGQLEIDAVNVGSGARDAAREWRLNRFNITTPEATLTASGNWAPSTAGGTGRASAKDRRRTAFGFKLDIHDSGALLNRFNMPGVLRAGKGKIEGQLGWAGSPITPDYPSMAGSFNVNVEAGQFLKTDPGIAKLLGVLSLQSLPRRLTLDFRDVFSEGFAFDYLRGDVKIETGLARTSNLQMKGVAATVLMDGQADIAKETQSIKVVVVPEINAGSASVLASLVNPIMGLSTFLAQLIVRSPFIDAITQEYHIDGTWTDPRVTKVDRSTNRPAAASSPSKPASETAP